MNQNYKALISYSHADQHFAKWLHRSLESYRVPRHLVGRETPSGGPIPARMTPVFRDREELASSPDLSTSIQKALENSENLIVICSPAAAKSLWVNQEIETFKKLGRSNRVFCLIVDGDPAAVGTDDDCFPPALRDRYDDNGNRMSEPAEPIAADLRKDKDGKLAARLKIFAGLLNVGFDELRQRDLHQRQRRMAAITGGSLLAAGIAIVLAVNAVLARNEANQRREQAEDLLGFMVGDLRKSLAPIGRLDLLEDVGQQAMEYFATVDIADLTDIELLRQAEVMTQLGEIRISQLRYDDALASFAEAFERSEAFQRNNPDDATALFNRSQAEYWVGFAHWRNGNLDDARQWLIRYRDSALALFALDSSSVEWIREVAYGHHNLAVLDQESGNLEAATEGFELEIEMLDALLESNPSATIQRDRADAISWMGNVALKQGNIVAAVDAYQRSAAAIRAIVEQDTENAIWIRSLAFALQLVAESSGMSGDLDNAIVHAEEAIVLFDSLVARDNTNLNWRRGSTRPRNTMGYILAARGKWHEADALAESSIALLEGLVAEGTTDHRTRSHLASAYKLQAWVRQAAGETEMALQSTERALANLQEIEKSDRLDDERLGILASIQIMRGELFAAAGDEARAAASWQRATDLLETQVASSLSPFLLDPWARTLLLTGQTKKGKEISGALEAGRYRPLIPWPD